MQGVSWEEKLAGEFFGPAGFDEAKIKLFVRPVNFVADQRMPEVGEMNPDLVGAPGARNCPNDREFSLRPSALTNRFSTWKSVMAGLPRG